MFMTGAGVVDNILMCSLDDNKLKFKVSLKSTIIELSYDGICSFQYYIPRVAVGSNV